MKAAAINAWAAESNALFVRRLGKTGEECGELSAVVTRCIIQGVDGVDPSSGKTNRERLFDELADVQAQIDCCVETFAIDIFAFESRVLFKRERMGEWESLLAQSHADSAAKDGAPVIDPEAWRCAFVSGGTRCASSANEICKSTLCPGRVKVRDASGAFTCLAEFEEWLQNRRAA